MQSQLFPKSLIYLSLIPFPLYTPFLLILTYTTYKAAVKKSFRSPLSTARTLFVRKLRRLVRLFCRLVRRLVRSKLIVLASIGFVLTFPRWPIKACNPSCLCALFWVLLTFMSSIFLSFYMPICLFTFLSNIFVTV
jgi:hypothetical protein